MMTDLKESHPDSRSLQATDLRRRLVEERGAIEAILAEATASGQPLSLLEQGRIDDRIARIKQLAQELQALEQDGSTA